MDRICQRRFALRRYGDREIDGCAVQFNEICIVKFYEIGRMFGDFPVLAPVHVLDVVDGDRLRFLVGQLDLKRLIDRVAVLVDMEVRLAAFGGQIERVCR